MNPVSTDDAAAPSRTPYFFLALALAAAAGFGLLVIGGRLPAPNLAALTPTAILGDALIVVLAVLLRTGFRLRPPSLVLIAAGYWAVQLALTLHPGMLLLRAVELAAAPLLITFCFFGLAQGLTLGRRWAIACLLFSLVITALATAPQWLPLVQSRSWSDPLIDLLLVMGVLHVPVAIATGGAAGVDELVLAGDEGDPDINLSEGEASELSFAHVFNRTAVGVAMTGAEGEWLWTNGKLGQILGHSTAELRETPLANHVHEDDRSAESDSRRRLLAGEIDDYAVEQRYLTRSGAVLWANVFVRRLEPSAFAPLRIITVIEDISERRHNEERLRALTTSLEHQVGERTEQLHQTMRNWKQRNLELTLLARMSAALQAAQTPDAAGSLVERYLPQIFQDYSGAVYLAGSESGALTLQCEWGGYHAAQQVITDGDCWAVQLRAEHRIDDPADPLPCAHLIAHRDHHGAHAEAAEPLDCHSCTPIIADGIVLGMLYVQWSERSCEVLPPDKVLLATAAEQVGLAIRNLDLRDQLERQAIRDPLTGLFNRRFLDDYLKRRLAECARSGRGLSVLMFDLDHFKRFNDEHGHDGGDHVLCAFAAMLSKCVRADEAVFRLGGEEFVLVINSDLPRDIIGSGERVRASTEALQLRFADQLLPALTVSGGAAAYPRHGDSITALIRAADQALYRAKREGRNRVVMAEALDLSRADVVPDANPARAMSLAEKIADELTLQFAVE